MPDNDNLREDQKIKIREAARMAGVAYRHIERGEIEEAKRLIDEVLIQLTDLARI
jgi:hypothetical protein